MSKEKVLLNAFPQSCFGLDPVLVDVFQSGGGTEGFAGEDATNIPILHVRVLQQATVVTKENID